MVKTTKDETNFINLVNRMKTLANKSVEEIYEDLLDNDPFNNAIDYILTCLRSSLKSNSKDRDVRLLANNPHLILEYDKIVSELEISCDFEDGPYSIISSPWSNDTYETILIKNLLVSNIPSNINKKMSLSLEKRIQIAKRKVSLIKKIDFNIDPYNSETQEEVTHNDVISKVSKMMKEDLSPFNIFLGIERLSNRISLFVDSDGNLGNVFESNTQDYTRFCDVDVYLYSMSPDLLKTSYIKMLDDRYGDSYDDVVIYYAKIIKLEAKMYLSKLLLEGNKFNLDNVKTGQYGLAILSEGRIEDEIRNRVSFKQLKSLIQHEKDPEQRKRFAEAVSRLLQE